MSKKKMISIDPEQIKSLIRMTGKPRNEVVKELGVSIGLLNKWLAISKMPEAELSTLLRISKQSAYRLTVGRELTKKEVGDISKLIPTSVGGVLLKPGPGFLKGVPSEELAQELTRRGWLVQMKPGGAQKRLKGRR